jgi:hypothetical protein
MTTRSARDYWLLDEFSGGFTQAAKANAQLRTG